jgi:hypothetical protein
VHSTIKMLAIVFLLFLTSTRVGTGEEANNSAVVATIEGINIRYEEVQVPPHEAMFLYKLSKGRKPITEDDMLEVHQIRQRLEMDTLAERLRSIIFEKQKARLRVNVDETEVYERWGTLKKEVDFDEAIKQQRQMIEPLLLALKAVYEKKEDRDAVYRNLLADKMTVQQWEIHLNYYRTPERRKILEDALKQTCEDLRKLDKGTRIGIRAMLVNEKMNQAIDQEIMKTDSQFVKFKALLREDEKSDNLRSRASQYINSKRKDWWRDQYSKAKIQVKDDRFQDIVNRLLPSDPRSGRP